MTDKEKLVAAYLNEDFPLIAEPFKAIAEKVGITEEELFSIADSLHKDGAIRRFGAVVRQTMTGFKANALCVWRVTDDNLDNAGISMSSNPFVTHCYTRKTRPDWPYNLYTMVHASDRTSCLELIQKLAVEAETEDYKVFFTVREWKKETLKYTDR